MSKQGKIFIGAAVVLIAQFHIGGVILEILR